MTGHKTTFRKEKISKPLKDMTKLPTTKNSKRKDHLNVKKSMRREEGNKVEFLQLFRGVKNWIFIKAKNRVLNM